jgi:hypothetical protein
MANKVSMQLLVSPHALERIRTLALIRTERQAEVARELIDIGLLSLELRHAPEIRELHRKLDAVKVDRMSAVDVMLKGGMTAKGIVSMSDDAVLRVLNAM